MPAKAGIQLETFKGPIAQRLEQWTHNPLVPGSNPGGPTNYLIVIKTTAKLAAGWASI